MNIKKNPLGSPSRRGQKRSMVQKVSFNINVFLSCVMAIFLLEMRYIKSGLV